MVSKEAERGDDMLDYPMHIQSKQLLFDLYISQSFEVQNK